VVVCLGELWQQLGLGDVTSGNSRVNSVSHAAIVLTRKMFDCRFDFASYRSKIILVRLYHYHFRRQAMLSCASTASL
jgi:hypothetical protein